MKACKIFTFSILMLSLSLFFSPVSASTVTDTAAEAGRPQPAEEIAKVSYSTLIDPKMLIPGNPNIDPYMLIPGDPDIDPHFLITPESRINEETGKIPFPGIKSGK